MFEPEVVWKQMYYTEESTCDIVGPFRRPTQWFCAPMVIRRTWNCSSFPPPHCAPAPYIHKLQSCINTAISPKVLSWACYVSTTKHYDKTVVLWLDITRGSDIVTEQERSLAISTSPRLSHQGCQIGHFMANFEKFGHFLSALAMIKRIWPFCKIWLFFDHFFGLSL